MPLSRTINKGLKRHVPALHRVLRWAFIQGVSLLLLPHIASQWKAKRSLMRQHHLPVLLRHLRLHGEGVEIGVLTGYFSENILSWSRLSCLHSVDPWREFGSDYHDIANTAQAEHDRKYEETRRRLAKYGKRSHIMRMTSEEASKHFQNHALDFVFIDANHSYEAVRDDIRFWWPKLKSGGIFAGHDYLDGEIPEGTFGVKKAVDEFVQSHRLTLFVVEEKWPTWYLQKPLSAQ